jgi:poly(A) polymerase
LISGHDLISLGFEPGPALGAMLREVEELQLEDKLRTREEAIEYVRSHLPKNS